MKAALITTTINAPYVLALYRKIDPNVFFFVAADHKTPLEAYSFCADIPDCVIYSPQWQKELSYACSELIGWNTIGRRNIALLEALKWGADIIITIDDDNIPLDFSYFHHFCARLATPDHDSLAHPHRFSGLGVGGGGWFDPGSLLFPPASHRGFPHEHLSYPILSPVVDARVGVMAGACLGDPDISAVTRIANAPVVHQVSELLRGGIVVDPNVKTVFNSQNTAFIRALAPCFLMVPSFGRYDDIFASLVAQRVMRDRNFLVHFGQPFVWQQRNQHDLLKDLRAEQWGAENIIDFAEKLDWLDIGQAPAADQVRLIYKKMQQLRWIPGGVADLASAWYEDLKGVL